MQRNIYGVPVALFSCSQGDPSKISAGSLLSGYSTYDQYARETKLSSKPLFLSSN